MTRSTEEKKRETGINVIGAVPWGTHICQFYNTKQDLLHILVPFFKAGLENNESGIWVTSEPLAEKEAEQAMRQAVPNFTQYLERGQICFVPHTEFYFEDGVFNLQRVQNILMDILDQALAKGYDGMRVTGNTAWVRKEDWREFIDYEEEINKVIGEHRVFSICTYSLDKCGVSEVMDAVGSHQGTLTKQAGNWVFSESSEYRRMRHDLGERRKELKCLYGIANIAERSGITLDEIYQKVANLLPQSWQYPEITCAKITINGKEFRTKNYRETGWRQSSYIKIHGARAGIVEISYLEARPDIDEGPFLNEERLLIKAVAERLGDITERKQAEEEMSNYRQHFEELVKERTEELQNARGELERVVDLSVDIIAVADLKTGFFTMVNPAFSRIIGYSQEEILNTPFMDFLHPDDIDKTDDVVADELVSNDFVPYFENRYRCKDGSYKWIAWTSQPCTEEGITFATGRDITALKEIETELESHCRYLESLVDERTDELKMASEMIAEDITERKQVEEALQQSEERLHTWAETSLNGFAIFSAIRDEAGHIADFRYDYINESGCQLNQRTCEEQIGHTLLELLPEHKDTGLFDEYVQVVETGQPLAKESLVYEDVYGGGRRLARTFDFKAVKLDDGFAVDWRDITRQQQSSVKQRMASTVTSRGPVLLQKRFLKSGLDGFEDREIVELLLSLCCPVESKRLAGKYEKRFKNLREFLAAPLQELEQAGFPPVSISCIKLLHELPEEVLKQKIIARPVYESSQAVFDYLYYSMRDLKKEVFRVIYLNGQNQIIDTEDLFEGTTEGTPVNPRGIIEAAFKHDAVRLIFVHNHPSGAPAPSKSDKQLTRDLVFVGNVTQIKVLDHIIIGENRHFSFADAGLIKKYEDDFLNIRIKRMLQPSQCRYPS